MSKSEVNVGVVGTGGFANQVHMTGYQQHPRANIAGVCDINLDAAKQAAETFGAGFITDDYNELVTRDDIDAIDIVTPNVLHAPVALAAIKAGKHVISEKPLAMSYAEAQEMGKAADAASTLTGVNFTYRGHPAARYAKQLIEQGHIGRIFQINAFYMQGWLSNPRVPMVWRLQKDMTGTGVLGDLGSHIIDLVEWLTQGRITSLTADMETFVKQRPLPGGAGIGDVEVDDATSFLTRFDNGALGTFVSSRNATAQGNYQRVEIYGDAGSLIYLWEDPENIQTGALKDPRLTKAPVPDEFKARDGRYGFTENVSNFIDAIADDGKMSPSFADGVRAQQVMEAIVTSAQGQSWVSIP